MTREEFVARCDDLSSETKYSSNPCHIWLAEMAAHDAEQRLEIARWKARSWTENVRFIAEAKENLLREYIHLTELYGEQKHEIRKLKADRICAHDEWVEKYQQLMAQKDRVIAGLSEKVKSLTRWSDIMFGTPCEEIRHAQQMEEIEEKYQQLLAQAVRFAQFVFTANNIYSQNPVYKEASSFLKEHT